MMPFQDCDPSGFCNAELDPGWNEFRNNLCRIRYGYPNCVDHRNQMFNQRFFGYGLDWIKYLDSNAGLGSNWITP